MPYHLGTEKRHLCQAIQWLSDIRSHSAHDVDEAARKFDLTPLDVEFLLRHCVDEARTPSKSPE